eukprot:scaffold129838_cov17-Tisochrysis_lutea.AAC.1
MPPHLLVLQSQGTRPCILLKLLAAMSSYASPPAQFADTYFFFTPSFLLVLQSLAIQPLSCLSSSWCSCAGA